MSNDSKTANPAQNPEKEAMEAKNKAKNAEKDSFKALLDAGKAETYTSNAIQKAEEAIENTKKTSELITSSDKSNLIQAGYAITEAKEAIEIAESARSRAESARNKAEESRHEAEGARNKAEEARLGAEETRTEAEVIRGSEEEARIKAEEVKYKAQEAKIQAEIALRNSEIAIAESQEARLEAEHARDKAILAAKGLKEYATSLEIINKDLEHFATIASHDLQAPLRKIRIFSEQVEEEAQGKLSAENLDSLQRIRRSAESMQHLINDLLALARASHHEVFVPVALSHVMSDVLSKLDDQISQEKAIIELGSMCTVMGDETQLRQIFQNLIENALKYQAKDRIPVIKISATTQGNEASCRISVEDNGIGFDPQYAERIFDTFVRLHGASSYQGSGIGLAICKRIAERHGGDITAKGMPDQGAVFTVILPTA